MPEKRLTRVRKSYLNCCIKCLKPIDFDFEGGTPIHCNDCFNESFKIIKIKDHKPVDPYLERSKENNKNG